MPEIKSPTTTGSARRGRPPGTNARALELTALQLFSDQGYDATTVEQIATAAGISRRSFFRYYATKADLLWRDFDNEVESLRAAFVSLDPRLPVMSAIRGAVLSVNHYRAEDVPELRTRIHLIATVPALQASSASRYDAWERTVSSYAGQRLAQPPTALIPLAIGRCTLAACRAAFDEWVRRADADITAYLDQALRALSVGFTDR